MNQDFFIVHALLVASRLAPQSFRKVKHFLRKLILVMLCNTVKSSVFLPLSTLQ